MQAGEFKSRCLNAMDRVMRTRRSIIITKRKKPIAKLVPIDDREESLFGKMKGTAYITGDLISPIDEVWDACR